MHSMRCNDQPQASNYLNLEHFHTEVHDLADRSQNHIRVYMLTPWVGLGGLDPYSAYRPIDPTDPYHERRRGFLMRLSGPSPPYARCSEISRCFAGNSFLPMMIVTLVSLVKHRRSHRILRDLRSEMRGRALPGLWEPLTFDIHLWQSVSELSAFGIVSVG